MILFFDTETTAANPAEARIVQLAAVLVDGDGDAASEVASINVLVKPEGFVIPAEAAAIHGITQEIATSAGMKELFALAPFIGLLGAAHLVVGHNIQYDKQVVNMAHLRLKREPPSWPSSYCTMLESTTVCKLPGKYNSYKWPKLAEAYSHFFPGKTFAAHHALDDVRACIEVYYALRALE